MSKRSRGGFFRLAAGAATAALAWRVAKRAWLYIQGTRAEPPALPPPPHAAPTESSEPRDVVDEAVDEPFPASGPPSYAGARGQSANWPLPLPGVSGWLRRVRGWHRRPRGRVEEESWTDTNPMPARGSTVITSHRR